MRDLAHLSDKYIIESLRKDIRVLKICMTFSPLELHENMDLLPCSTHLWSMGVRCSSFIWRDGTILSHTPLRANWFYYYWSHQGNTISPWPWTASAVRESAGLWHCNKDAMPTTACAMAETLSGRGGCNANGQTRLEWWPCGWISERCQTGVLQLCRDSHGNGVSGM